MKSSVNSLVDLLKLLDAEETCVKQAARPPFIMIDYGKKEEWP
jgi:hypothetical protein